MDNNIGFNLSGTYGKEYNAKIIIAKVIGLFSSNSLVEKFIEKIFFEAEKIFLISYFTTISRTSLNI
jgi:hypothetical protein